MITASRNGWCITHHATTGIIAMATHHDRFATWPCRSARFMATIAMIVAIATSVTIVIAVIAAISAIIAAIEDKPRGGVLLN